MKRTKDKPSLKRRQYTPPARVVREWSAHIMEHPDGTATFKEFKDDVQLRGKLKIFDASTAMASSNLEEIFKDLAMHSKTAGVSAIQLAVGKIAEKDREKEVAATLLDLVRQQCLSIKKDTDPMKLRERLLELIK